MIGNKHHRFHLLSVFFFLLLFSCTAITNAQSKSNTKKENKDILKSLKFRNIGPAIAGGRVSSVAGIPGNPNIIYAGAAGGGVWKTTDGGNSWKAIFKKQPTSSIGAIALAPSNPNLVWVGTGEANIRNDIADGKGVYFSPDAGATWKFMGLKDAGQISKIIVDPENPDVVFVAAIGHAWAPNKERGLFKTTDGGKHWKKVLFVNDTTGVTDVVFQPGNPMVMLAASWQVIRYPWKLVNGGTGSAVYQSKDGGNTWEKIKKGIPKSPLGRIAFAASPSKPDHVYALIESKHGLLYDSHNFGTSWKMISNNHELDVRPFYFSTMEVSPVNDQKVYFLSFLLTVSNDGGKTVKRINNGIHVDHHAIWIDPKNPERIIEGNDGGVYQSLNAGKQWHYFDNIPIEQFYQVAADTMLVYHLGGGLQDNNAWYGPSHNLHGGNIDGYNWYPVAGGDGEYVVPAPSNPNIIYAESQDGWMKRLDKKTGLSSYVRPYIPDVSDMKPADLKYRFNWTTPIAVSYKDENEVYMGANVVFKTMDGGNNWKVISPDLTTNDKSKQQISGGPIQYDISGAETYCTILSIGLSKKEDKVIWVGTDDGQVQVTKDGGKSWTNVTKNIPDLPKWGRIYQIEVSPFSPAKCYIAVDFHMLDNNKPYVYKTDDYGKNWTSINKGLPSDEPAHVVREDPNQKGLLVLGNETGLFYSKNDGETWEPLKSNFPTAPVWDLKFVKQTHDIAVATHGRGVFILDNITPLEELNNKIEKSDFHLFSIQPSYFFNTWRKGGFNSSSKYKAPNPPSGAVIDYYLKSSIKHKKGDKKKHNAPVEIKITDSNGTLIDTLHGTSHEGINRITWNLRYKGAEHLSSDTTGGKHPSTHNGPRVLPGTYNISVSVNGKTETQKVKVKPDPYVPFNMNAAKEQLSSSLKLRDELSSLNEMLNRIVNIKKQIKDIQQNIKSNGSNDASKNYDSVLRDVHKIDSALSVLHDTLYNTKSQPGVGEDEIHFLSRFHDWFRNIYYTVAFVYNKAPRNVEKEEMDKLEKQLMKYVNDFNKILKTRVANYNKLASGENVPTILQGAAINLR